MLDRQWVGDLALAVLLALPLSAVAKAQTSPQATHLQITAGHPAVALAAERYPGGRISLYG